MHFWFIFRSPSDDGPHNKVTHAMKLVPPSFQTDSPQLLDMDDATSIPPVAAVLQNIHPHLPPLPPKHTYLRTPVCRFVSVLCVCVAEGFLQVPTTKKQALPSLEKKLENAARVQTSLKNLLTLTEDGVDNNDGELFGGVVNWESTRQPRKKWKLSV